MKKLYRKGTVHPSPPIISDHLSFLPATILTLAAALSPEDRELLAYLISCSNNISDHRRTITQKANLYPRSTPNDHPPSFNCDCFSCYMSYWVRWDSSPNRQLIHEIIDAYEDGLLPQRKTHNNKNKKDRKRKGNTTGFAELKRSESSSIDELAKSHDSHGESSSRGNADDGVDGGEVEAQSSEKGSVRRFVSLIGERIWGVIG